MSRKTRADSILEKLPANQQEMLERWLFEENLSYLDAQKRLFEDFNVRCSTTGLAGWRQRKAQDRLEERVMDSARKANAVVSKFEENPADIYSATLNLVGEIALREAMKEEGGANVETLFNLTKLMIANRKEDVRSEALSLQREIFQRDTCKLFLKWHENEKAKQIAGSSTSNTEKIERLGELMFGEDWK